MQEYITVLFETANETIKTLLKNAGNVYFPWDFDF